MYYVKKTFEVAGCHHLYLSYPSKCQRMHGHNWMITVYCKSRELDENGMVIDFSLIKEKISSYLDHGNFNELLPFNPTAENIARWVCDQIPKAYRVDVLESRNNMATYERDED